MFNLRTLIKPIVNPFKRIIDKETNRRIRSINPHWAPIIEFSDEDVFIVGYPKSGNTWFQNLIGGIIYGVNPEHAPDTLIQELVPDVHYKKYYKRFWTPMFFKSHHLPRPEYKRVAYLLRDGRDVMVSYYHHNKALMGNKVDFLKMVKNGTGLFPCKWHEHVEAWLSNPYDAKMILIKYEDLKKNPVEELKRFCAFVGIEREDSFLNQVVENSSFAKMRQKEIHYGWDNPRWPKNKFFVRRGQVGSHKDEMPSDVLEAFLSQAGEILRRCGYLNE